MKGIDIFCASQAATAIRLSMDEASSSSPSSTILLGSGRAIDRHNPIIRDSRRITKPLPPCSSEQHFSPKPHKFNHNYRNIHKGSSKTKSHDLKKNSKKPSDQESKSSSQPNVNSFKASKWSCTRPGAFVTPPGSSRYLLSDKDFLGALSDFDPVLKLVPVEPAKSQASKADDICPPKESKPPSPARSENQVVVLRVSLHCRGCERKMRKHISRMEGVSSFSIDFAAKKVTVVGDVTPLDVLASISKVKNAQLWSPAKSYSTPPVNLVGNSELDLFQGSSL